MMAGRVTSADRPERTRRMEERNRRMVRAGKLITRSSLAALTAACLVFAAAGYALADAASTFDARYQVRSMGLDLGRARLELDSSHDGIGSRFRLQSHSLLGMVDASDTRMRSTVARAGATLTPQSFTGIYSKDDRVRDIKIGYDADGAIDSYQLAKRDKVRLAEVPQGLGATTIDPLAALLQVRAWLSQAPEGASLALHVFDGRKRYDSTVRYLGLTQLKGDAPTAAHRVALSYVLVAELDEDTGKLQQTSEAKERQMELAVSTDGRFLPLRLDGSLDGLPVSAVLDEDCTGPAGCAAAD